MASGPGVQARVRALALLAVGLTSAACGTSDLPAAGDGGTAATPPTVSAPATLLADGAVPFVYEPAGDREFDQPQPTFATPQEGDRPCTADGLSAVLPSWIDKSGGSDEPAGEPPAGLYGYVIVTPRDGARCTLQGQVSAELTIDGVAAPVEYSTAPPDPAQVVTVVAPGSPAQLRVDWSTPYCGPTGAQQLSIDLPDGGGTLSAPVEDPLTPACWQAVDGPDLGRRTFVATSFFAPHDGSAPLTLPVAELVVTLESSPERVQGGDDIEFRVKLTNPTDTDIPLNPCPGYLLERLVTSDGDAPGFNESVLMRLNCRAVNAVAARSAVTFVMQTSVPDDPPGPTLFVTWGLRHPGMLGENSSRFFTAAITDTR